MNNDTYVPTGYDVAVHYSHIEICDDEDRKFREAIAAEDNRRRFVALCVRLKPVVLKIRTAVVFTLGIPRRITRQHKTKQNKVLQLRFT